MALSCSLTGSRLGVRWTAERISSTSQRQPAAIDWAIGLPPCAAFATGRRLLVVAQSSSLSSCAPASSCGQLTQPARTHHHPRQHAVCAAAAAGAAAPNSLAASAAVIIGWLVIAGSCIRSLPQILRILKHQSVRGLSLTSFSSELFCYMVSVAYNLRNGYAFSTFGDTAICALQNAAIIGLIFRLGSVQRRTQLLVSAGLLASAWWLFGGACQPHMLTALQTGSVVLLAVGGRLPQILLNVRRGNSGELSLLTCALSLAGNLARVFTTATLVKDPIILASAATQALLNGILTYQTVDTARRLGRDATGSTLQSAGA